MSINYNKIRRNTFIKMKKKKITQGIFTAYGFTEFLQFTAFHCKLLYMMICSLF